MPLDVSRIRAALEIGFDEGAAWFSVDEKLTAFAPHKSPRHRAIVVRRWSSGPVVTVFPRSTSSRSGLDSPAHEHRDEFPTCWIGDDGKVVVARPLAVDRSTLTSENYMCAEPFMHVTDAILKVELPE